MDSVPPGAAVYVDGRDGGIQGHTSPRFRLLLERGTHTVRLELSGHKPVEERVAIERPSRLHFVLEQAPAWLEVVGARAEAVGAEIWVDGALAGRLPQTVQVAAGSHRIEVRKPGLVAYVRTLTLEAAERQKLVVDLKARLGYGAMRVAAAPGAQVLVDGVPRGAAPVVVEGLSEGEHHVEVHLPDPTTLPWRRVVQVVADQLVHVVARPSPPAVRTGSLLVLVPGVEADVVLDGMWVGKANRPIDQVAAGPHWLDVRAEGYRPLARTVTVAAGQQRVEKVQLERSTEAGVGTLRVIMAHPVAGAHYVVNGQLQDEAALLSPQGIQVPAGRTSVLVRKKGYAPVRKDVELRPGGHEVVTVELRREGQLRVQSEPAGARLFIDGTAVGHTPYGPAAIAAGTHTVALQLDGHQSHLEQVDVTAGEQTLVQVQLEALSETREQPPSAADPARRAPLSSFAALTLERGAFTVDAGAGYPYFLNARTTIGLLRRGWFGLDGGVDIRTTLYQTDVGLHLRAQLLHRRIVALGASVYFSAGGGPRARNSFVFEGGIPLTVVPHRRVRLTLRPMLQVYADQHCPTAEELGRLALEGKTEQLVLLTRREHDEDRCTGGLAPDGTPLPNAASDAAGFDPDTQMYRMPTYDPTGEQYQLEGRPVLSRFVGIRLLTQAVLEISLTQHVTLWALLEGAPLQGPRHLFTRSFNPILPERDFPLYGRAGVTLAF
ncbi:MAG: PEGA domain-containing protein [Myxococcales bacterium]|nr:PEGA domain-containing protein [Myxococcales bacterium]